MKTIQIFAALILFFTGGLAAQTTPAAPAKPAARAAAPAKAAAVKGNYYIIKISHTKEECVKVMDQLKTKGDAYRARFDFGCKSGDHTAYAMVGGLSEDNVRSSLPAELQKTAKLEKVEKFTAGRDQLLMW